MGYSLNHGNGLNSGKGLCKPLQPFVLKEKPANYYDHTCRGLGYITLPPQSESESDESLPSKSSDSSNWDSDISVGGNLQKALCQHDIYQSEGARQRHKVIRR